MRVLTAHFKSHRELMRSPMACCHQTKPWHSGEPNSEGTPFQWGSLAHHSLSTNGIHDLS